MIIRRIPEPTTFTPSLWHSRARRRTVRKAFRGTEIKKYQEELQNNIKWLAESNKELEQYAYVASHDLQEPLRKIMVYGTLLKNTNEDKLDEKGLGLLSKINHAAERMSGLIYGILNYNLDKFCRKYISIHIYMFK